jgi:AcrR family transcriptional regulator
VSNLPQPGRPPATTRAEVAHVALELFAARGYEETTLDDVAAAVGVSRRTLFRYYDAKPDMVWADFTIVLDVLRSHLRVGGPDEPWLRCAGPSSRRTATRRRSSRRCGSACV